MSNWRPIIPVPDGVKIVNPRHPLGDPSAGWKYLNPQGRLLQIICRFNYKDNDGEPTKTFLPLTYCENETGARAWCWQALPAPRPLYKLDKLAARPDAPVLVCEGEKAADAAALLFLDFVAITSPNGCKAANAADWSPLTGRRVVIWPDNDKPGRDYAADVGRLTLAAGAVEVRVVAVPDEFPLKWDLADTPPEEWDTARLRSLLDAAEPASAINSGYRPSPAANQPPLDCKTEVSRLAALSPIEYDNERADAAKRLGCRVTSLDEEVKAARGGDASPLGQGCSLNLPDVDPWPEPVDGAALLDALASTLREYVIVSAVQADAISLWNVHTHAHDASDTSPKLVLKSPQKRSGKSRLVEVLARTVARACVVSGITPAALLRIIESYHPTLLMDEMDAAMKQDREMAEALRGIMNSGFNRTGARYIKNVPIPDGGWEPRGFSTWTPQLASGIGDLPDTVRDRSIEIEMKRKRRDEKVKRLRRRDGHDLDVLGRKSARWAADNMEALRSTEPNVPPGLNDRAADAWEPLFAIADLAGGEWPRRARNAALALSGDSAMDDDNIGSKLLSDLRDLFAEEPSGVLFGVEIVERLVKLADRPWAEFRHGRQINPNRLAVMLKPYGVHPGPVRRDCEQKRGYRQEWFDDAFSRYLPP